MRGRSLRWRKIHRRFSIVVMLREHFQHHTLLFEYLCFLLHERRCMFNSQLISVSFAAPVLAPLPNRNAYLVSEWRKRGKDQKDAANFAYNTLLPDYIPQSINI